LRSADLAPSTTPTISTVTYERPFEEPPITNISGLTTAPNGNIFLGYLNGVDGNIEIAEPIQARGSGDITLGSRQNGQGLPTLLLNSDIASEAGNITFASPVILGEGGSNILSQSGNVTFADRLEGAQILRLDVSNGNVLFNAAVGEDAAGMANPLNGLSINTVNVAAQSTVNFGVEGIEIFATGTANFESAITSSGRVIVEANGNVTTNDITSAGGISLTSRDGSVITNNLDSSGVVGSSIIINALTQIRTDSINTSGSIGNAGNIFLDPIGDVEVTSIDATAPTGIGGTVDITAGQFFRATGTFTDQNGVAASISTAGGQQGGSITLRHGGSFRATPFVIGNASINGTAGVITTGFDNSLIPFRSIETSFIQGDIPEQIEILTGVSFAIPPTIPVVDNDVVDNPLVPPDEADPSSGSEPGGPTLVTLAPPSEEIVDAVLQTVDQEFTEQYESYYGQQPLSNRDDSDQTSPTTDQDNPSETTLETAKQVLRDIQVATGVQPAIIYAFFIPPNTVDSLEAIGNGPIPLGEDNITALEAQAKSVELSNLIAQSLSAESCIGRESYWLSVILVTPEGEATWQALPNTTCTGVIDVGLQMRTEILERDNDYLEPAQTLFNWLIAPIKQALGARNIDNLVFIADQGLRAVPLAALHDGEQYLIENYSVGMMPSLAMTDTSYTDIRQSQILISGISDFEFTDLENLDAVPFEVDAISSQWLGTSLIENEVTQARLVNERNARPFGIVHLATHAKFEPGDASQSYIQLWGERLSLDQVREMGWGNPVVEMLVLSACETASDSREVELGFAGFASQAGVKSTFASLWNVEDLGTAALMTEFYQGLQTLPTKAESLRAAQLAMLDGKVQVEEGRLYSENFEEILPEDLLRDLNRRSFRFSHPYYWSGFTIVGNPW
jgi:CHAT domain-containing protein